MNTKKELSMHDNKKSGKSFHSHFQNIICFSVWQQYPVPEDKIFVLIFTMHEIYTSKTPFTMSNQHLVISGAWNV